jgi:hypothetical protein
VRQATYSGAVPLVNLLLFSNNSLTKSDLDIIIEVIYRSGSLSKNPIWLRLPNTFYTGVRVHD